MKWFNQLKRIRRFLRDPDKNIWSDAMLMRLYNDVQRELQHKTKVLETAETVRVPSLFAWSYFFDWEWGFMDGTQHYKALRDYQGDICCFRWELEALAHVQGSTADEGNHFTQPWEAFMADAIGDVIPIRFPSNFHSAKWIGWDKKPLEYRPIKTIQSEDMSWVNHSGQPEHYYRLDELENVFHLYPVPSAPVWDDIETEALSQTSYVYCYDWEEESEYLSGTGVQFVIETDNDYGCIWRWETAMIDASGNPDLNDEVGERGMFLHERGGYDGLPSSGYGIPTDIVGVDLPFDVGVVADRDEVIQSSDYGISIDVLDADDNVFMIYRIEPTNIESMDDESDFHEFLQKYIEYGVLERAYAANTDGRIESLRDYWAYRKELGLKAIKHYMIKRRTDRDYRLTTRGVPGFRTRRQPRLPDEYPAVW